MLITSPGYQVAVVQFSNDVRVELPLEPLSDVDDFKNKINVIVRKSLYQHFHVMCYAQALSPA